MDGVPPEEPAEPAEPDELDCEPSEPWDPWEPDCASDEAPGLPPDGSWLGKGDSVELVEPLGLCCGNGDSRLELELERLEELELWLPPEELDDEDDDDGDDEGDEEGVDGEEDGDDEGDGSDGGCGIDVDMLVWQPASARASAAGSNLRVRL